MPPPDGVTGDDGRLAHHRGLEALEIRLAMAFERDLDQHGGKAPQPGRVDDGAVAGYHPGFFKAAQPFPARSCRQACLGGEVQLGDAAIALQGREDLQIDLVEFQHGAGEWIGIIRMGLGIVSGQFHVILQF